VIARRLALLLAALALAAPTFANPVIAGDHPDPTVVRAGGAYYASATTSAWAPAFPVFRSADLVHWEQVGAVLDAPPPWVTGRMWAPELVHEPGRFLAYWGAARAGGGPCLAVSTAARAAGPWRYRGRVACPPGGAIDPAPFRDADGTRWLLYRARGAIRVRRLTRDGLRATGPSHVLLTADAASWEQGVVEGPSLVRTGDRYLLFYAGGHCCRVPCTYAEGVAAAPSLLSPYVKDPGNPVLHGGGAWTCPGHGTVTHAPDGSLVLLHHATAATDIFNIRRQVLLDPVVLGADGWPVVGEAGVPVSAPAPAWPGFSDRFGGGALRPGWEWLFDAPPSALVDDGALTLRCDGPLRFVARQVPADRAIALARFALPSGDAAVGLAYNLGRGVRGVEIRHGRVRSFAASPAGTRTGPPVRLRTGGTVTLAVGLAPGGHVATYVGGRGGALLVVPPGPAASGAQPTRVALTCRGHGAARVESVKVRLVPGV
jgi:beta-xylosidase